MDGRIVLKFRFVLISLGIIVFFAFFAGCSDDESPTVPPPSNSSVEIEMTSDPLIQFDGPTGKTSVIVQFIARDENGYALDLDDVNIELLIDENPVDNESILQDDSEELSSSIYLSLVLDASFSMLQHSPPAFDPMLEAARNAIIQLDELYEGRPGSFDWNVTWFNEVIFEPSSTGRTWVADDLLAIVEPTAGTATKLFAAVDREAHNMLEVHEYLANGPHDHHVMVVFSDGVDNYSWFDNSTISGTGVTTSGAGYDFSGYGVASLDSAVTAIETHPLLTSHVMGLGSDVEDDQLQAISDAGNGQYFKNPSSSEIDELFALVTREFATIQNHGATIPLQPGDYLFGVRVSTSDGHAEDEISFLFHAGDDEAGIID